MRLVQPESSFSGGQLIEHLQAYDAPEGNLHLQVIFEDFLAGNASHWVVEIWGGGDPHCKEPECGDGRRGSSSNSARGDWWLNSRDGVIAPVHGVPPQHLAGWEIYADGGHGGLQWLLFLFEEEVGHEPWDVADWEHVLVAPNHSYHLLLPIRLNLVFEHLQLIQGYEVGIVSDADDIIIIIMIVVAVIVIIAVVVR